MQYLDFRRYVQSNIGRELLAVAILVIASIAIADAFDLNERLVLWSLAHPELEIFDFEEMPLAFTFVALGLTLFTVRRWREYRRETIAHKVTLTKLTLAMEEVVAANQAKSQFLANMSHELRTPLNAVLGFADLIRSQAFGPNAAARYCDYAEDIHAAGTHLLSVVSDVLDMARSDAGVLRFEPAALDLSLLLEEVRRMLEGKAQAGCLALSVSAEPGLLAWADADRLRQAVLNIAGNAVQFTPAGGRVSLVAEPDGDAVAIRISDTGIGIAPDNIPHALTPFEQIDNGMQRRFEGTGLGLPLAKTFVEKQGGSFTLESTLGAGTVVTIRIPLASKLSAAA